MIRWFRARLIDLVMLVAIGTLIYHGMPDEVPFTVRAATMFVGQLSVGILLMRG